MKTLFNKKSEPKEKPRFKVFGVPLEEVCTKENLPIPSVAEELFEHLEQKGLIKIITKKKKIGKIMKI